MQEEFDKKERKHYFRYMEFQNSNVKNQNHNAKLKSTDIKVRAYQFALTIIQFINNLPNKRAFWIIGDQLLRASTSIGANILEAKAASSRKDFIKYYEIALKSANETKYWLSLLQDSYPELKSACETLLLETSEICNMLGASVLTLKGKRSSNF